jgi:hypothetical protein
MGSQQQIGISLIDSQDGVSKALRALTIRAPGASCEALKREKPPTLAGQRLYSKTIGHRQKRRPGTQTSRTLESLNAPRNPFSGSRKAWAMAVTDQFRNRIDRFFPCPKTSSFLN